MKIDPITLAVIRGSLEQIADEMDATLERMAFSPVISDGFDRASGIYDKTNGEVIMQGPRGLPSFIYVMEFTTRTVIERIENIEPGDIYIVNDPYLGGTHLMDVKMVKPVFYKGKLTAFLANSGHWPRHRRSGARRVLKQSHRDLSGRTSPSAYTDFGQGGTEQRGA